MAPYVVSAIRGSKAIIKKNNAPRYETPSYFNEHGKGYRPELNGKFSTSGSTMWGIVESNGLIDALHDGATDSNGSGYTNDAVPVENEWMQWDFGHPVLITEIKMIWNVAASPCGVWKIQGYNGTIWIDVGNTFTLGTDLNQLIDLSSNTEGYPIYRMIGVSGNSNWNLYYWSEIEFKIGNKFVLDGYEAPSYFNEGGIGDRRSLITVTSQKNWQGDTASELSLLLDGIKASQLYSISSGESVSNQEIFKFDFGGLRIITECRVYGNVNVATCGTCKWQGSTDNLAWEDIGGSVAIGGVSSPQTITTLSSNAKAFRYYRLFGVSGVVTTDEYLNEFEFRIGNPIIVPGYQVPSYSHKGGKGNRTSFISVTSDMTLIGGDFYLDVDGSTGDFATYLTGQNVAGKYIAFSLPDPCIVSEIKFIIHPSYAEVGFVGTIWQWKGSNDGVGVNGVSIGDPFTFPTGESRLWQIPVVAPYKYQWMEGVSGVMGNYESQSEIEFKIGNVL